MPWYDVLGGRKFALATGAICMAFVLALAGKLTGDFVTVASIAVGAFNLANASTTNTALKAGKDVAP